MRTDKFGQMIHTHDEVFDIIMHNVMPDDKDYMPGPFLVADPEVNVDRTNAVAGYDALVQYVEEDIPVAEFDRLNQLNWLMPENYKQLDIVAYILSTCNNDAELQRCGEELLLYADRNMLDLLRYMKYLVDTMELNNIIWGVGRGSSVASFVLYKLKVHKIDSMFYQLDPTEFLR